MQWVSGDGVVTYEFPNNEGAPIWVRDFFGTGSPSPKTTTTPAQAYQRPAEVPLAFGQTPRAFLTRRPPGDVIDPHFHEITQYQVVVEGKGSIGQHALHPLTVHFTDAYTPYGPIVTSDEGLAFFTIRPRTDNGGTHYMPKSRDRMPRRAGRALTVHATVGGAAATREPGQLLVDTLIDTTEDGVQSKLLSFGAGAIAQPANDGPLQDRFLVVVDGSLVHDGESFGLYSCIYGEAGEATPELTAGPDGAQVLLIQFPTVDHFSA
jgi:hypothetical protein